MRAADIELLLPEVMRRTVSPGSPLAALLAVMEAQHAPAEAAVATLPSVLDPLTTPDRFVDMLAEWVDLARLDQTPAGHLDQDRLRLLVSLAPDIAARRGTAAGLLAVLAYATGVADLRLVDSGPFHVTVVVPAADAGRADLVREVAAQEKPAHLVVSVEVAR